MHMRTCDKNRASTHQSCIFLYPHFLQESISHLHTLCSFYRIVFDDTEDIFADKITQQALLALNEATAAIMVSEEEMKQM